MSDNTISAELLINTIKQSYTQLTIKIEDIERHIDKTHHPSTKEEQKYHYEKIKQLDKLYTERRHLRTALDIISEYYEKLKNG